MLPGKENSGKTAENAVNSLKVVYQQPLWRWIAAIGIPTIAHTKSPILEEHYPSFEELTQATYEDLFALNEFGEEKSKNVIKYQPVIQNWADRLKQERNFTPKPAPKKAVIESTGTVDYRDKKVVVSGTFPTMGRKEVEQWVKDRGAKISSGVSSSTDYLIYGEKAGTKLTNAQKINTNTPGKIVLIEAEEFEKEAAKQE